MVQSLTWALECDRPQRRRSVLLPVLEVDLGGGRRLKRCTRRSKFDEASSNVLVNRQDQQVTQLQLSLTNYSISLSFGRVKALKSNGFLSNITSHNDHLEEHDKKE